MSKKKQGNPSPQENPSPQGTSRIDEFQQGYATKNPEKLTTITLRPTPKK